MSDVMALRGFPPASIEQRDSRRHAVLGRFQGVHERLDSRAGVLARQGFNALGPSARVGVIAFGEGAPDDAIRSGWHAI